MPLISFLSTSKCIVLIIIILNIAACSKNDLEIWRQVPIQMARVTQTESYSQTFQISTNSIQRKDQNERDKALDERMDNIFTNMTGARNWQYLKNLYGISSVRDELMTGKIHMDGLMNFTIYLDPTDFKYLVAEGTGRYFAIRDKTNAILMSGDFHIPPQRYAIKSLTNGCLPLDIKLYITGIPGKTTYYKDIIVRYDLIIDTSNSSKNAYSINYASDHNAFLDLNNDGIYDPDEELVATMKMNDQYHQTKLFDIRGLLFLKKNYSISPEAKLATKISSNSEAKRQCVKHKPDPVPLSPTFEEDM